MLAKPERFNKIQVSTIRGRVKDELQGDFVQFDFMLNKGEYIPYIIAFKLVENKQAIDNITNYIGMTPILFDAKLFFEPNDKNGKRLDWKKVKDFVNV